MRVQRKKKRAGLKLVLRHRDWRLKYKGLQMTLLNFHVQYITHSNMIFEREWGDNCKSTVFFNKVRFGKCFSQNIDCRQFGDVVL